jgi:hypothetical protein
VQEIKIEEGFRPGILNVAIDGISLSRDEANSLFYRDGFRDKTGETFESIAQAAEFWAGRLPFRGRIIH